MVTRTSMVIKGTLRRQEERKKLFEISNMRKKCQAIMQNQSKEKRRFKQKECSVNIRS